MGMKNYGDPDSGLGRDSTCPGLLASDRIELKVKFKGPWLSIYAFLPVQKGETYMYNKLQLH